MLVDGVWHGKWDSIDAENVDAGAFRRKPSSFRGQVTANGAANEFAAAPGRYHLYVAMVCPWACRTLMVRKLKRLDDCISFSVVEPALSDQGWRFPAGGDSVNDATYLHELYSLADGHYSGRATVPVLWDIERRTIVNNESAEIIRMLNGAFDAYGDASIDLYPAQLRDEIDAVNEETYEGLNNGVYRAGFATGQAAYEDAVAAVFRTLDALEDRLEGRVFLVGDQLTEADIRVFVTLIRFDVAYHGAFKCNIRKLIDYPNLWAYTRRIYDLPGIAETVNLADIKRGYYSIPSVNPTGIVPVGPELDLTADIHA
jgi:putative glutathione S-transferase